jgi:type VI secretion system protein ImpL
MTIRRLLLILFLYILLVWILAAYLHSGDMKALTDLGLLWTAVGVAALLVGVLLERVISWWRGRQMQKTAKPTQPAASKVLQEDDLALLSLIKEADQRLAQAPGGTGATGVLGLPLFLALGSERAGKTAVIHNSGMEPALLAGQVLGNAGSVASTKVANLWLVHQSLLLEVSGRLFNSERLGEFLSVLQPADRPTWKSWVAPQQAPASLRGVLLFFDVREFMGTPEPSKLDRAAQNIRARLRAVAQAFGAEFPVYVLFTNTDALPYFEDFFNSMSAEEAAQVLGVLKESSNDNAEGRVWSEAETKRLNQLFQSLFLRLSDRRLIALSQETDPARKPSIYEFPREFRRIRAPLNQFLVDVFKPDPLAPGPQLRGFFFTGTQKVEDARQTPPELPSFQRPRGAAPDATQFFAANAATTMMYRSKSKGGLVRLTERWAFATEFFQKVLSGDRPLVKPIATRPKFARQRRIGTVVGAALGVLLALIWTVSWIGNWGMVSQTEAAVKGVQAGNGDLNLTNLQALDRLREQLEQLYRENPLHLHWGLYTGDDLRVAAAKVYFARLKQLSLDRMNQTLAVELRLAGSADQKEDSSAVYDLLKTHRTIAARACEVDQPLVRKTLLEIVPEAHKGLGDSERALLDTQLSFYVTQLAADKNLPVSLTEDTAGVANARSYVRKENGLDQRLRGLLSEIGRQVKPLAVSPEYRAVLSGPAEFPGAFSKEGQLIFEDRVTKDNFSSEERCVMGESAGQQVAQRLDTGARDRLRSLYYREYADAWRDFLKSYSVLRYGSLDDAVQKLSLLSDSQSPLLKIVRMAAENTNFQQPKQGELNWWDKAAQKVGFGGLAQAESDAAKTQSRVSQILANDAPLMTAADVATLFQPVLVTTPPADLLVNGNDKDYVEGLRKLREGLDAFNRASTADRPNALAGANATLMQARAAHAALADKFPDVGKEGLNKLLSDLLKQPIDFAFNLIPANSGILSKDRKNGELSQVCKEINPILAKYPFNSKADVDASLNEVEKVFAPTKGLVWQYLQKSASDLVVPKDQGWDANPGLQGLKVDPALLIFLNRSQDMKRVFFSESGIQKLVYVLRKVQGQTIGVHLILDGQELLPEEGLRKTFTWPGTTPGAEGNEVFAGGGTAGFGKFDDPWAVFRLFQNADERPLLQREVKWSYSRGRGGAALQPMNPPPKIEVVEFPGGVDLFNPKFFEDLKCPGRAVLVN